MEGVEQTKEKYTHGGHTLRYPFEHQLNIDNEKQDCKIGIVCVCVCVCVCVYGGWSTSGSGEGEGRRLRWWYMADGFHITIWNRTKKALAIALSGLGRGLTGRDNGENVNINHAQYKSNQNCHNESPWIMNIS
jgi:hypothetical protein